MKNLREKLKENYGDNKERERKLDLLKYQYSEIKQADPVNHNAIAQCKILLAEHM